MHDNSSMHGNSRMCGDSRIGETQKIIGKLYVDITKNKNKAESLYAQTLHYPTNGKVILFKRVKKTEQKNVFTSCYDENYKYEIGKIAKIKGRVDKNSTKSCDTGLHFSHLMYWEEGDTTIACEIDMNDVITIQEGKVRATKCKVLEEVKL